MGGTMPQGAASRARGGTRATVLAVYYTRANTCYKKGPRAKLRANYHAAPCATSAAIPS